jgi:hypothetical protein
LVLLGFTAPVIARGQNTPQPVPANGQCSVPGDSQWTPQETFVWQHVCVGETADFNKGPDYGGYLDPKRPEGLPESRIIRPAFLETILIEDKYRKALRRHGVRISGARLTDILDLENIQLVDEFELTKSLLEKGANFIGLTSTYAVILRDSNITGQFQMVGGHLGGQLAWGGAMITGPFRLDEVQIDGSLFMDQEAQFGNIALVDVHVGGQLKLTGSKVKGQMIIQGVQIYSTAFVRDAEFDGPVYFNFSRVGQNVELAGGFFRQNMDLTETQIGGELVLGRPELGPARWAPNSVLILRNTTVGAVQDLRNSWPDKLDLNGFSYRNLRGIAGEHDPMINRTAKWFEGWLGKQAPYAPAPYQQLASVLREQGFPDTGDEVLYAGKQREQAQSSSLRYIGLTASKWFLGYGYHLFWSVYWAFGFLVVGTFMLWFSGEGWRVSRHYNLIYGVIYSFDLLLPIIRLRERHYQIDLKGWVRYYFYLHKIMGYVLASFLIAGIAGLTK